MLQEHGTENGIKRKTCNLICIYSRIEYILSLKESPTPFCTNDVETLYTCSIYHKDIIIVIKYKGINKGIKSVCLITEMLSIEFKTNFSA